MTGVSSSSVLLIAYLSPHSLAQVAHPHRRVPAPLPDNEAMRRARVAHTVTADPAVVQTQLDAIKLYLAHLTIGDLLIRNPVVRPGAGPDQT